MLTEKPWRETPEQEIDREVRQAAAELREKAYAMYWQACEAMTAGNHVCEDDFSEVADLFDEAVARLARIENGPFYEKYKGERE